MAAAKTKADTKEHYKKQSEVFRQFADQKHLAKVEGQQRVKAAFCAPAYTSPILMAYRMADYLYRQDQEGKPYTEMGLANALNIDKHTFNDYAEGQRDYLTGEGIESRDGKLVDVLITDYRCKTDIQPYYYVLLSINPEEIQQHRDLLTNRENSILMSNVLKKARALVSEQREQRLATRGSVADIFTLKAREGWQDEKVTVHRMEIATAEEAEEAIKLLK